MTTEMLRFKRLFGVSLVRVIVILVVLLILLQLLHMSLLSRLEAKSTGYRQERYLDQRRQQEMDSTKLWNHMKLQLDNTHISDYSGVYQVLANVLTTGDSFDSKFRTNLGQRRSALITDGVDDFDVTIVTQSSTHNLYHVIELLKRWLGPISVSVFTYGDDVKLALKVIAHLYLCNELVRKYATFHLVYPLDRPPKDINFTALNTDIFCEKDIRSTLSKEFKNYDMNGIKYPHNLLRNLAIKYSRTPYVFMLDIDMIPSAQLRNEFYSFVQQYSRRKGIGSNSTETGSLVDTTAFVIPVFEVEKEDMVPRTKGELLNAWDAKSARPFYYEMCWKCQRPTDYNAWKAYPVRTGSELDVSHYVQWKDPWEPFYIAKRTLPAYDERFKQYGFNRISQVCELHVAGYAFAVLDNAFLIHKGYKYPEAFHSTKEKEQDENRLLFRQFKEELKTKYPKSNKRCY